VIIDLIYAPPGLDVGQRVYDSKGKGCFFAASAARIYIFASPLPAQPSLKHIQAGFSGHPFGLQMGYYHRPVETLRAVIARDLSDLLVERQTQCCIARWLNMMTLDGGDGRCKQEVTLYKKPLMGLSCTVVVTSMG
jgi:hypothetical protein